MPDPEPLARPIAGSRRTETPASAVVIDLPSRSSPSPRSMDASTDPAVSDVQATADYIAQLSSELARLADGQQLTMLSYFLDMAAVEARSVVAAAARR